eukprot:COSAG01_NODE_1782_length_9244_cov_115.552214_3_plen_134_part_00
MVVCCLAGAARMVRCYVLSWPHYFPHRQLIRAVGTQPVSVFVALNVNGTLVRLVAIRAVSSLFPEQVEMLLDVIASYRMWFLLAAVAVTAASSWNIVTLLASPDSPTLAPTTSVSAHGSAEPGRQDKSRLKAS